MPVSTISCQNKYIFYVVVLLTLIAPAFYNGYPLVYSDTGTYIGSGMDFFVPDDRTIFYGLFIRLTSINGISLWTVIAAQSILLLYSLEKASRLFLSFNKPIYYLFSTTLLIFLAATTSVAWYSSQIMPDIFVSMLVLTLLGVFWGNKLSKIEFILLSGINLLCLLTHFSHVLLQIALLFSLTLACVLQKYTHLSLFISHYWRKLAVYWAISVVSVLLICGSNWYSVGEFKISKGSHVFMCGRLIDTGLLPLFLQEQCATHNYSLCKYKDSLPDNSSFFLFNPNSPIAKEGGWNKTQKDCNTLLHDFFTTPRYLLLFGKECVIGTCSQLLQNSVGSGLISSWYQEADSPPYYQINKNFKQEFNSYLHSRQNKNLWKQTLQFDAINSYNFWILLFAFIGFLYLLFVSPILPKTKWLLLFVFMAIVANAFITATFSVVCDRLQSRIVWLLPWIVAMVCYQQYSNYVKTKTTT